LETASQLNIYGFVKNLPDGAVYIEAEGSEENIEAFISWCRHGPPWAHVDTIEIVKTELQHFTVFEILR
jgi:acylphosphatase